MVKLFAKSTRYNASYPHLTFPAKPEGIRPGGSLEIKLDNGYSTIIPNDHLFTPKRGSDDDGHYVVTNSSILETGIAYNVKDDDADTWLLLGGLFLTFNYLVVDYDKNQFQMAPIVKGAQASGAKIITVCTPVPPKTGPDTSGSSRAVVIGGGTAGAVAGFAAIASLIYFFFRKRRRTCQQPDQKQIPATFPPVNMDSRTSSDAPMPTELASTTVTTYHELPDKSFEKELPSIPTAG
ncbi:MAG: hypothetical protein Q9170_007124 [Blastenia crenularia]